MQQEKVEIYLSSSAYSWMKEKKNMNDDIWKVSDDKNKWNGHGMMVIFKHLNMVNHFILHFDISLIIYGMRVSSLLKAEETLILSLSKCIYLTMTFNHTFQALYFVRSALTQIWIWIEKEKKKFWFSSLINFHKKFYALGFIKRLRIWHKM